MKKKTHFIWLLSLIVIHSFWAQNQSQKYDFVSIKEGISKVGIYSIEQDSLGFVWLGTNGAGLCRFDGLGYKSYKYVINDSTSLSSSIVLSTHIDNKDRLWVGTEEGLSLYNREQDNFKRIPNSIFEEGVDDISISSLYNDNKGSLLIGAERLGLYRMNMNDFEVEKVLSNESLESIPLNINAIKPDKSGKIYVGTDRGLKEYDYKTGALKLAIFQDENGSKVSVTSSIESLLVDEDNTIWAGSESNGIFKISVLDVEDKTYDIKNLPYSSNKFLSLTDLKDGTILCGTENDGLYHLNYDGKVLHIYSKNDAESNTVLSNSIWSLYVDRDDRIWIGYYNKGVSIYDSLYDKFDEIESIKSSKNSLNHNSVTAVIEDKSGKLWIASDGGGIDILDKKSHTFTHVNIEETSNYSGLTSDYIESLFIDSNENIWAGSWDKGLFMLKKGAKRFVNFNPSNSNGNLSSRGILTIAEDKNGLLWFGSYNRGLHSYNPKTNIFTHYNYGPFVKHNLVNSEIRKIIVDDSNALWIASPTSGFFKIDVFNGHTDITITPLRKYMADELKNHNSSNNVYSLYEDSNKTIWIGTRGAGLYKYDKLKKNFLWYNSLNGLSEENINGIIGSNDGDIWLAGNSGITRFQVDKGKFTNYSKNDGLLSDDYNINSAFKDGEGVLYFGNFQGVDYFNPSDIAINTILPELYFTDFKLFNESVLPNEDNSPLSKVISNTDTITLNSNQSVFTIEYSSIGYTRPEKNQYAYYLEGYEDSWNYVGEKQSATYTNLDAGDYVFKLKASNNDRIWNEIPLVLHISILPPWWKTTWAIGVYILLFLLGLYLLNKITQTRLRDKQLVETERNNRLLEKELNEKKLQFFTNISHEFRTPLSLIIGPLEDIIKNHSSNLPANIRDKHGTIHKNTQRLFRLINELLDFRRLELNKVKIKVKQLNLVSFTRDILSHFQQEASIKNIHLSLDTDLQSIHLWADESMLEKIIFNIVSNAFKVTPEGGAISVDLSSKEDLVSLPLADEYEKIKAVEISISDTGPGLKKKQIEKIFDRFYKVDNLNNSYYGSTGIGLEVVQNFVKLHKGKINVKSELGRGTTFNVILPAEKKYFKKKEILPDAIQDVDVISEVQLPLLKTKVSETLKETESTGSHTLLIVEDNTELRNYLKNELKSQYKIILAKNGKEGLELAKSNLPDIIMTDVIMPEMDGFAFCKHIKTDMKTSHIPLLMLTAKTQIENRIQGIENGADAYMVKPFDVGLLKLRLSQLITSRQLIFNKYFSVLSDSDNTNTTSLDKEFIEKVLSYINESIADPNLNVESLASQLNLSRSQFYRKIKALTNQTANEFIRNIRLMRAKQIIESGSSNISEVCYNVGFSSPSYFTKCFKSYFGVLPKEIEIKQEN